MNIYKWYKVSRILYLHHIPVIPMLIKGSIRIIWGGVIPFQADIGDGTQMGYQGLGIVIHKKSIIGKNCVISQNVTIGGGGGPAGVPIIGNNVKIGAGAVLVGGIHIGDNAIIGANSFVNRDIPSDCVAVGTPAKPVKFLNEK